MKKKLFTMTLAAILAATMGLGLTACGNNQTEDQGSDAVSAQETESEAEGASDAGESKDQIRVFGMLTPAGITEDEMNSEEQAAAITEKYGDDKDTTDLSYVFYDTLNSLVMGLSAGDIECMMIDKVTAQYLVSKNPAFEILDYDFDIVMQTGFGVLEENEALLDDINGAIEEMKEDGTLDDLKSYYIIE